MKLIKMVCPNCGASLEIDTEKSNLTCSYCNNKILIDDEVVHLKYDNAEEAGYLFEKGRQRAAAESKKSTTPKQQTTIYIKQTPMKSETWLWVLGWIFIFPVPLTILMLRNKKMDKKLKYGIIAGGWIFYLIIAMISGGAKDNNSDISDNTITQTSDSGEVSSIDSTRNEMATTVLNNEDNITYAEDTQVNKFITDFNNNSIYKITDISKGNIRTKYYGYANNRYLEMINTSSDSNSSFSLSINGGQEETDKQEMFDVFKDAVKIFDQSLSDEYIDNIINDFTQKDVLVENHLIGNKVSITYVPVKELSTGKTSCRIDMLIQNYT